MVAVLVAGMLLGTGVGVINLTYLLYLLGLAGMYILLSMGLNVQWGYAGLINFSVAAFFGLGAYGTALMTAKSSPIAGGFGPLVGLVVGLVLAGVVAVLIGIPTLRLRADYLAIASLGLAEVVRLIILNQRTWTNGSAGLKGIPRFFANWPLIHSLSYPVIISVGGVDLAILTQRFIDQFLNFLIVVVFIAVVYALLRRVHRSPWGRVLRTIRSDEDLAEAIGKNTYWFKMQSFVIGSLIMALAGVFYVHLTLYLGPGELLPKRTFYVWIAVILGGSGSNRGALFGGFAIIALEEGTRFAPTGALPMDPAAIRLLLIGLLIIAIIRLRPEGLLPPKDELIWPGVTGGSSDE
ncbi:MAG: branched-chain amino acid ABC transporter permease [Halorientalis sp.]